MQAEYQIDSIMNKLSFPNATYYIQERELNFAFEKGFLLLYRKNWKY